MALFPVSLGDIFPSLAGHTDLLTKRPGFGPFSRGSLGALREARMSQLKIPSFYLK